MEFWMIQNNPEIASYCLENGVDRIFIDLEKLDKEKRQGHLNTWKSNHVMDDIDKIRGVVPTGKLLVRLNKWNKNSKNEIFEAIERGADFLMLPMINSLKEIETFCETVNNKVPVIPLIETYKSLKLIPEIINIPGILEIYLGLNDLSISLNYKFCFETLMYGYLEDASRILNENKIPWGFGGIARSNEGILPAEIILGEHVRLGSHKVILSKTFHRNINDLSEFKKIMNFKQEINKLSAIEKYWQNKMPNDLEENRILMRNKYKNHLLK